LSKATVTRDPKHCKHCQWWEDPKRPAELFTRLGQVWDVDMASVIAEGRTVQQCPTAELAQVVDWPKKPRTVSPFKVSVLNGHLDHVDTSKPVLIGSTRINPGSGYEHTVLDGHHRIARAVRDRVEYIPVIVLTYEQTRLCYCGDPVFAPPAQWYRGGNRPNGRRTKASTRRGTKGDQK
jgi:hypothetical protein